jgi:hydroxylaminobenzene mutase
LGVSEEKRENMSVQTGGRQILIHGMALVLVGLVWGFVVPLAPYPRLALGAHIQFETNGMLFMVLGVLLLKLPHNVGSKSVWVMLLSVWGTWAMALSEAANAWWGTNQMLPIAASQAGATGGEPWQEFVVKLSHVPAALGLILSWTLLIVGFVKPPSTATDG